MQISHLVSRTKLIISVPYEKKRHPLAQPAKQPTADIQLGDICHVNKPRVIFDGRYLQGVIVTALECPEPMDGDDTGNCDGPRVQFNHGDFEDGDSGVMIFHLDGNGVLQHASNQEWIPL